MGRVSRYFFAAMSTPAPRNLTIWCNARFTPNAMAELTDAIERSGHRLTLSSTPPTSNLVSSTRDAELDRADVALGQPDPEQIMAVPRLKWVHLTSAGYTRYDRDDLRSSLRARGALLTNSSLVYQEPCAEHCLAMMLALARRLPQCMIDQQTTRPWKAAEHRIQSRLLVGQTAVILGYGAIARRLVELLRPLRMNVVCVRRRPAGNEGVPVVPEERLDEVLATADHVVNTLPETERTIEMFNARRFAALKRGAFFYNIGRGTTVDQSALLEALRTGKVGAAYLDVTSPEPLPPDHPLWSIPNCYITPHTAGGHHDEFERLVRHFLDNLGRFERGEELADRIV
jgi:phosphoglycerate dehydrogenase-like enzyme